MKILLLSTRVGSGHIRAADAVAEAIRKRLPAAEIRHLESFAYASFGFARCFMWIYGTLVNRFPAVWRALYECTERQQPATRLARLAAWVDSAGMHKLRRAAFEFKPDYVLCTHYLPAEMIARERRLGRWRAPLGILLTDYALHTMWVQPGADQYFVASEEMAADLRAKGAQGAEIVVSGIPLVAAFSAQRPDPQTMRRRLKLDANLPTILLACGGLGWGGLDDVARQLSEGLPQVQILVVAGRNEALRKKLEALAETARARIVAFGYVDNMHELMAASDFAITKCGGLTATECLATGLPMLIVNPIPGQEERNSDYLQANGLAVRAHSPAQLVFKARSLLSDRAQLERMKGAARILARPDATDIVADAILSTRTTANHAVTDRNSISDFAAGCAVKRFQTVP